MPGGSSTCRSARRATRRRPSCSRPWPARGPSGATRRRSARPPTARRPRLDGAPPRRHGRPVAGGGLRRHQGARGRAAALAAPAPSRSRHRAVPGDQLPVLRDGCAAGRRGAVPYAALEDIDPADAARALCLWVNVPGNPTGELADLGAAAAWGRAHGVPVLSDECYVEFTWDGPPARSSSTAPTACWPCTRCRSARTWPGSGPASTPATPTSCTTCPSCASTPASWCRARCRPPRWRPGRRRPRRRAARPLRRASTRSERRWPVGVDAPAPDGAFYLWAPAPDGDAWALTERLAEEGGALVSPGEFYGELGAGHVRVAVVQPDDRIALVAERLAPAEARRSSATRSGRDRNASGRWPADDIGGSSLSRSWRPGWMAMSSLQTT